MYINLTTLQVLPDFKSYVVAETAGDHVVDTNELKSLEEAQQLVHQLGDDFITIDRGEWVHPQYDVMKKIKVGDPVSKAFNGDYYPCGVVATISPTMKKITTTNGCSFFRNKQTERWLEHGCWSLVSGHVSKQNPSF